jgi:hypothetical protein
VTCAVNPGPKASGNGSDHVGDSTTKQYGAQSFTVASTCNATAVGVGFFYIGSPIDTLTPEIWSDSGGSPSAALATGSGISPAGGAGVNLFGTSTISITLNTATTYWIVWRRSGANDALNYWGYVGLIASSGGCKQGTSAFVWTTCADGANMRLYYQIDGADPTTATPQNGQLILFGEW